MFQEVKPEVKPEVKQEISSTSAADTGRGGGGGSGGGSSGAASAGAAAPAAAAGGGKRRKKDPDAPAGKKSAYCFWAIDQRKAPEYASMSFGEREKLIAARWKTVAEGDKTPFHELAKKDSARHADEIQRYTPAMGGAAPPAKAPVTKKKAAKPKRELVVRLESTSGRSSIRIGAAPHETLIGRAHNSELASVKNLSRTQARVELRPKKKPVVALLTALGTNPLSTRKPADTVARLLFTGEARDPPLFPPTSRPAPL